MYRQKLSRISHLQQTERSRFTEAALRQRQKQLCEIHDPAEAAALRAQASANHGLVMWFVTLTDPAHSGRAVAYAIKGDNSGGCRIPGELVADTIKAVRTMLPAGLRRHDLSAYDPVGTVGVWD